MQTKFQYMYIFSVSCISLQVFMSYLLISHIHLTIKKELWLFIIIIDCINVSKSLFKSIVHYTCLHVAKRFFLYNFSPIHLTLLVSVVEFNIALTCDIFSIYDYFLHKLKISGFFEED